MILWTGADDRDPERGAGAPSEPDAGTVPQLSDAASAPSSTPRLRDVLLGAAGVILILYISCCLTVIR